MSTKNSLHLFSLSARFYGYVLSAFFAKLLNYLDTLRADQKLWSGGWNSLSLSNARSFPEIGCKQTACAVHKTNKREVGTSLDCRCVLTTVVKYKSSQVVLSKLWLLLPESPCRSLWPKCWYTDLHRWFRWRTCIRPLEMTSLKR